MKRYLILANGDVYEGEAFGAAGEVLSEIVFTTAMTGYLETLTDKSYKGQAVVQTFPLIGNYGIIPDDREGEVPSVSAYIVRETCGAPSNFRCELTLDEYLKANGIPGLKGIDTRALTRDLREKGVMNGLITDTLPADMDKALSDIASYRITDPVKEVSVKEPVTYDVPDAAYTVAMIDCGIKNNIIRSLNKRGCKVVLLPYDTGADDIRALSPDGIFISNGPGDPEDNTDTIRTLQELDKDGIPTMGICLGHQLLALAHGFRTSKLKYGHRGANHPVKNMLTGRVYISSQNHGYAVVEDSIDRSVADVLYTNVNDGTNEGIIYKGKKMFSVQFHPEACGGPKDTEFLFDDFIRMMSER
ncbi:carbamoyl-phosphate synthase small subunit [Ruminococcaceae bacterium YRB3002]|nr:carbamoyl-phosphate synthase small subunit [Ruminococcaceae bacterium YRB3002]